MIDRRRFVLDATVAFLAMPLALEARQTGNVYRIGYLGNGPPTTPETTRIWGAFVDGLRDHGYAEGRNIVFERRYAEGRAERFPDFAAELVRLKVDLIVTVAAPAALAAKRATTMTPIVAIAVSDPVGLGLVASLARPGGNVTGLATLFPELGAKRLALLREAVPGLSRVAGFWNAANPGQAVTWQAVLDAARTLGVALQSLEVRNPDDFDRAFAAVTKERPEALFTLDDPLFFLHRSLIVDFAAKQRLPAMYAFRESVGAGGLMAYSVSLPDLFRAAANYVDRILRGAKPAELPIEQPTKFDLVINLRTAKALGLTIPPSLLLRADKVIE